MATVNFTPDNSLQGTTTSIISTPLSIHYLYAYNTTLNSKSTFTKLDIDNLNSTSTSVFCKTYFSNLYVNGLHWGIYIFFNFKYLR
jgi:hypothetical protein